ncbi:hypothetical protein JIR23_08645 [Bradyrhizobium diazoefficiens]|nr:hypothetical protein [Bradyrhizobium diazoefficiens]QQN65739.1 hypothetical protein JIR23_08645 [Bradyrhizobium diazoefficiens]
MSVRALLLLFGLAAVLWPAGTLPTFRLLVPANHVTERIVADSRFKPGALGEIQALLESQAEPRLQHPDIARARALVSLRTSEEAMARGGQAQADRAIEAAEGWVRSTLAQSPGDSFLWMMRYSVAIARGGFDEGNIRFLDRSYATGPLEGWIALRRNRLALASFPMLGGQLQDRVVAEFAGLVDSDLTDAAVSNLEGVGWSQKDRLLAGLGAVDIESKERLSKWLSADGIRVKIPGVEFDERPWR